MADPNDVSMDSREGKNEEIPRFDPDANTMMNMERRRERQRLRDEQINSRRGPKLSQGAEASGADSRGQRENRTHGQDQFSQLPRARFYEEYCIKAKVLDRAFTKKYDDCLTVAFIFALLFSAGAVAVILLVLSRLQQYRDEKTAALTLILADRWLNPVSGDNVPASLALPPGPPPDAIERVISALCTSVLISLFSAFLAIQDKQWLNQYLADIHVNGTAVERGQVRERRYNALVAWGFDRMMELPPQILQVALLPLVWALIEYLWKVDTPDGTVDLRITSFVGFFCYFAFLTWGASSLYPIRTPEYNVLRSAFIPIPPEFSDGI